MEKFPVPSVLECMPFIANSSAEHRRLVQDYEFDLYVGGERDVWLDGVPYHLSNGSLIFRKPGQWIVGKGEYNMYLLTLDFSHAFEGSAYYRNSDTPRQPLCDLDVFRDIPSVFTPFHQKELRALYETLFTCSPPNLVDLDLQRSCIKEFLFLVLADAYRENRYRQLHTTVNPYVKAACTLINERYAEPLLVKEIAQSLSLDENYLIRLFRRELNTTPRDYLEEIRLLRARQLLLQTDQNIQSVALQCGFNTPSYFISRFQKRFGERPRKYRETHT